jgi:peptidoglycan-N-acetylglucosamine deacetylase
MVRTGRDVLTAAAVLALLAQEPVPETVITRIPTKAHVVALTFDACEAGATMHLDEGILVALRQHPVPFTVFASGRFVEDNESEIAALAALPGVHIENHSWDHPRDFRRLSDAEVVRQVTRSDAEIQRVTGRKPVFFRFPGGYADDRVAALVSETGHRIVHWRWAEGDPDRAISADRLVAQTLERTGPGDILILHINGRGWHTAEALPELLQGLEDKGYRFVDLEAALDAPPQAPSRSTTKRKQ